MPIFLFINNNNDGNIVKCVYKYTERHGYVGKVDFSLESRCFCFCIPSSPFGREVSSSRLPVPSTNSSYVDLSGNGRGPSNAIMSSRWRTSCFSNCSAT